MTTDSSPLINCDNDALRRLLEVARKLAAPIELTVLLESVINAGRDVLGAERGTVFLYDAPLRELFTVVATGVQGIRFGIDKGIAGECARTRKVINVPDCYADPRFNPEVDRRTGYRTRSLITVPLVGLDDELVGVLQLLNPAKGPFDATDLPVAETLASQAAVAIQRARLMDERMVKLKLERDLDLARQIQMQVLPRQLPVCPGYDLATFSRPADQTGGDIYDLSPIDPTGRGPLFVLLADATGHGIGPALSVTQMRSMCRIALRLSAGLDQMVEQVNRQLTADLGSGRFVTAFIGLFDPVSHRVRYHAAGQGPLLHFQRRQTTCRWHNASALPLGIMEDAPMDPPEPIDLAPGDLLVLLTDGFYEYQDQKDKLFGRERVEEVVLEHHASGAQALLEALVKRIEHFAQGAPQRDDLTAVVLRRTDGL